MKVAIQGETGSFSHEAAKRMVPGCGIVPCARSAEVFDRLERGSVNAAVIPIENSLAGSVAEHFDLLLARKVFIQTEYRLRIVHNLIAAPGVKMSDIRRVYSHPVALDQCRRFFRKHAKIESTPFYDTAGGVKHVIESGLRNAAGIAGRQAASVYKGRILAGGIEDDKRNFTRFFLIRKRRRVVPGANKTSIAFRVNGQTWSKYSGFTGRRNRPRAFRGRTV
jgi:prephenate dehydratase